MAAPGDLLDERYRLGPVLGRGGMADVYRARDLLTSEDVAVKLLRTADATTARWLEREQAALGRLDHPALVRLRATGTADDRPYLVLDLIDGRPLADVIQDEPLTVGRTAELGACLADGLAHAHAAGVTHRDVKPANILIDAAGRPHLADFGIARLSAVTTATAAGSVIGTAAYLAPEQVRAEPVGPPADIYALGLVLIECLTGRRCFPGTFQEAAMAHLARAPEVPAGLPPPLHRALVAATALDPGQRPPAADLAATLASIAEPAGTERHVAPVAVTEVRDRTRVLPGLPPPDPASPAAASPDGVRRRRRRTRATVVAAGVGGVVGLSVALAAVSAGGSPPAPSTTVPSPVSAVPSTAPPSTTPGTTAAATTTGTTTTAPAPATAAHRTPATPATTAKPKGKKPRD